MKESPLLISISKHAGRASRDFNMINEGDKIAVAVSGGKDSLSLLHILRCLLKFTPVKFSFEAIHIDFEFSDFNPQELTHYLDKEKLNHRVVKVPDLKGKKYEDIDCYRWSRHRRKALFQLAGSEGFTKIAFGHHMDDIAETIILNQFYRGEIGAMKPKQELFNGKITIIRPLAYIREDDMVGLSRILKIDSMGQSKCANDDTSYRMKVKQFIHEMEQTNPAVVKNIFRSLQNIKTDYLLETVDKGLADK